MKVSTNERVILSLLSNLGASYGLQLVGASALEIMHAVGEAE